MGLPNILILVLGLSMAQCVIQYNTRARYPVTTILSKMKELTSAFGNCSFPPKEVLNNNTFDFLDMCDKIKMPSLDGSKPVSDPDVIMCLGLLELGLRLCLLDRNYFKNDVLFSVPHDKDSFNSLVQVLKKENDANMCTRLKNDLQPVDSKLPLGVLNTWSLQKVLHEKEDGCSRICLDYKDNPRLLCKLILWGIDNVLKQSNPQQFQTIISHSVKVNVNPSEIALTGQSGPSETDQEKPYNQNVPSDQKSENEYSDRVNNVETGPGNGNAISSSSEMPPVETKNVKKTGEGPEVKNESTDAKQSFSPTKAVQNPNEPPSDLYSFDGVKHVESIPEPSTTNNKKEVEIKENPEKSQTNPNKGSVDDTSKDLMFEEKGEKIPIDENGKGDDVRDPFDPSSNQDLGDDDDLNPPDQQNQLPANHESIGYKTDTANKFPQDDFSNSNTFVQERFEDSEGSHFFSYFMGVVVLCIVGYVVFHNKQKILALALEGRSRRTTRRRPTTANYHKLDNNLEEAVSSPCNTSVTHVIY